MRQAEARSDTPSLAQVVRRAAEVCDPAGSSPAGRRFRGALRGSRRARDRSPANAERTLREAGVDPEDENAHPPEHVARWLADQGVDF